MQAGDAQPARVINFFSGKTSARGSRLGLFEPALTEAKRRAAQGDLLAALSAADSAIDAARPAFVVRARVLNALGRPREALEEVMRIDDPRATPKFLEFRLQLEEGLGLMRQSGLTLSRLLKVATNPVDVLARRALSYRAIGDFDSALSDLNDAITLQPKNGELHLLRGELVTSTPGDGTTEQLAALLEKSKHGSPSEMHLLFALAKAYDDQGEIAKASAFLKRGNARMRASHPYDKTTWRERLVRAKAAFGDVVPDRIMVPDASTVAPIFVTGLPRSGTTLVEQILSAHGDVVGGGEVAVVSAAVRHALGDPDAIDRSEIDTSAAALARLGEFYANEMYAKCGVAKRYTDKSLQTLLYAGPILTALPRAHIVVVRRHPQAVALSLFKQVFRPGRHLFSYDLDDIRHHQSEFDSLLAFWQERLPKRFHVVDYEAIVTEPDDAIPELLKSVDLQWDNACLYPESNGRAVRTLSAVSVRAPINMRALDAWRAYGDLLGEPTRPPS